MWTIAAPGFFVPGFRLNELAARDQIGANSRSVGPKLRRHQAFGSRTIAESHRRGLLEIGPFARMNPALEKAGCSQVRVIDHFSKIAHCLGRELLLMAAAQQFGGGQSRGQHREVLV